MIGSDMAREGFVVAGWTMPSSASLHSTLVQLWWHFYSIESLDLVVQQLWARLGFDVLWFCSCSSPMRCLSGSIAASPWDSADARHH